MVASCPVDIYWSAYRNSRRFTHGQMSASIIRWYVLQYTRIYKFKELRSLSDFGFLSPLICITVYIKVQVTSLIISNRFTCLHWFVLEYIWRFKLLRLLSGFGFLPQLIWNICWSISKGASCFAHCQTTNSYLRWYLIWGKGICKELKPKYSIVNIT